MRAIRFVYILLFFGYCIISYASLPNKFVYLSNIAPNIFEELRYATSENFVGNKIPGYESGKCILTNEAAQKLKKIANELRKSSLALKVYDCYRPAQSVHYFYKWSQDFADQRKKQQYYPNIEKANLFRKDYIALHSGHSRGSTIDLTIIDLKTKKEFEMGTHFDYLDPLSHPNNDYVSKVAYENRQYLRNLMIKYGFLPLYTEWWHFSLKDEPYPSTYFDFPVK